MLENPESFKYGIQRENFEDWTISRQLLTSSLDYQKSYSAGEITMLSNNPNKKGTLGEIAVCKDLLQQGYDLFFEFGNHSKVDLVVLDENYNVYKLQIKAVNSMDDAVNVYSIKTCLNPKYNSSYTIRQVDIFAISLVSS